MNYTQLVQEEYDKLHNKEDLLGSLAAERSFYESFIRDLFSEDKEAARIKEMFQAVEKSDGTMNDCINFENANTTFTEYLNGMVKFVEEVCQYDEVQELSVIESCNEQLTTALEQDHAFIRSLFENGQFNPFENKTVKESVSVLSSMIDFIPVMEAQENKCKEAMVESKNDIKLRSMGLLCESVSNYWMESVTHMLQDYEKLCSNLFPSKEEDVKPEFVLV